MSGSKFYGKRKKEKVEDSLDDISQTLDLKDIPGVHRAVNIFRDNTGRKPVYMKATVLYDPKTQESMVESIEQISDSYPLAVKRVMEEIVLKLLRKSEDVDGK